MGARKSQHFSGAGLLAKMRNGKIPGQSAVSSRSHDDARAQRVLTYFQPIATSNFTLVFQQHDQQSLQNSEIGNISTMEYAECSPFPPDPLAKFLLRSHADYPMLLFAYRPHSALPIRMLKRSFLLSPTAVLPGFHCYRARFPLSDWSACCIFAQWES